MLNAEKKSAAESLFDVCVSAGKQVIPYAEIYKRIRDCWLAKCISGNIGFHLECYKRTFNFKKVEDFAPEKMYPNDDLDLQLVWLNVLLENGAAFTSSDLTRRFIKCYQFDFSEYGYAKRNFKRGIIAPHSGEYNNHFKEGMGCAIRSEIWALAALGDEKLAVDFARRDATIDHADNAVEAECFFARTETAVFTGKSLRRALDDAYAAVPKGTRLREAVGYVFDAYDSGKSYPQVYKYLHNEYGDPDGTYVVINTAIVVCALLYGGENFDEVMVTAVNGGYDTDCTCATAGAIFGLYYGVENIAEKWRVMADGPIVTDVKNLTYSVPDFDALAGLTADVAVSFAKNGVSSAIEPSEYRFYKKEIKNAKRNVLIRAEYDKFEIGLDEEAEITLYAVNLRNKELRAKISAEAQEHLLVSVDADEVTIPCGGTASFKLNLRRKPSDGYAHDSNVVTVRLIFPDNSSQEIKVGVAGKPVYRVSEIFTDGFNYEGRENLDELPDEAIRIFGGEKVLFHTDCNEYANNWVRKDHRYIEENFTEKRFDALFEKGERYESSEDNLNISAMHGFSGPAVVYAFQKLVLEEDRILELHIGSTDPYKMWINNELISVQEEGNYFSPYNQRPRVVFRKGVNRIVVKVVRTGKDQTFKYVLREEPFNHLGCILTGQKYLP